MIWMGLISITLVCGLCFGLKRFGRQGFLIAALVSVAAVGGSGYLYWNLGAYEMSLSAAALNGLPEKERAFVIAQGAQEEFIARNRVADQEISGLFELALDLDPNQLTALGSLGIIAFESGEYSKAADFWSRMLDLLPSGSDQANAIAAGVNQARQRAAEEIVVRDELPGSKIVVTLSVSGSLPESMRSAKVFVFAREVGKSLRPIVAKRLSASELPEVVTLSNQDAIMGGQLSQGLDVQIMARLTLGDATGDQGEWLSAPIRLTLAADNTVSLSIEPPKP